jgi:xanthine dehydrogenase large subunit
MNLLSSGRPLPHESAVGHVTGTAAYIDDLPLIQGELFVDYAGAPIAAGTLDGIELEEAFKIPGIVAIYKAADLPGHNIFGPIFRDEPFLVDREISYLDQPIVVIAATSRESAWLASKAVKFHCTPRNPILTIEEALAAESFIGPRRLIERGDVDDAFVKAPFAIDGIFESNGQEQLYFESQAAIAIPCEGRSIKVLSSTQNPTETQMVVAEALGLQMHQVVCECRRMGGGFGGKETQSSIPAAMAALVAYRTGKSARINYRKDQDMLVTGKRHPYKTWYRAAFDGEGRILAMELKIHSNGGAFADLSTSVLERTMLHSDNAYFIPNARITAQACRTNLPPNTAFRGFGGPQGVAIIENVMQEISIKLGRDALDVRRINLYCDGDDSRNTTPYGQIVRDHILTEIFDRIESSSDYRNRMAVVTAANQSDHMRLKGLAISPIKFGISFTTKFLNQGNALVNVFIDGSIQVSSGGTEMGQGLNTKLRQIVADEFGIDPNSVSVMATSTEKNHNTSPTAASAGTDLNGMAALNACREIKQRMSVYAANRLAVFEDGLTASPENIRFEAGHVFDLRKPARKIAFSEFCGAARRERVDMGARGFYATPGVDFNRETGRGNPFYYFTTGAAVSEVTIDRWTGDITIDRCDILMDLGKMINPAVDLGQVIGGFIQGVGWCTTEELKYDDKGRLLSVSPTTYKIPNITDVPTILNVDTIENPKHTVNVFRSKAVGEPPLMLGISVWLAIKHALSSIHPTRLPQLSIPATNDAILPAMTELSESKPLAK